MLGESEGADAAGLGWVVEAVGPCRRAVGGADVAGLGWVVEGRNSGRRGGGVGVVGREGLCLVMFGVCFNARPPRRADATRKGNEVANSPTSFACLSVCLFQCSSAPKDGRYRSLEEKGERLFDDLKDTALAQFGRGSAEDGTNGSRRASLFSDDFSKIFFGDLQFDD
jgi:hypothetical protein